MIDIAVHIVTREALQIDIAFPTFNHIWNKWILCTTEFASCPTTQEIDDKVLFIAYTRRKRDTSPNEWKRKESEKKNKNKKMS